MKQDLAEVGARTDRLYADLTAIIHTVADRYLSGDWPESTDEARDPAPDTEH